jgi:glycine/D-amino acid oxidase-like deaminating enzyme
VTFPTYVPYVVVGAGVHGLSTAYHLAEELGSGRDVVLLERQRVGAGASGVSGGIVRNFYRSPAVHEIVRRSVELFELDPGGFGFRQVGYVAAVGEPQQEELAEIALGHAEIGYASELVLGAARASEHLRAIFPDWRAEGVTAVLHERRSGWTDAQRTVDFLAGMTRSLGVRVVEGAEVVGFDIEGGAVRHVETTLGRVACDVAVVAPGPWARELWRLLELPDEVDVAGDRRPTFSYLKVREGDYALPGGPDLDERSPVVHLDLHEPLVSDRDGHVLDPGPWGIYFRPTPHAAVAAGGLPVELPPDCELDPYGPSHPVHGAVEPGFDEWLTSALAAALGRFRGRSADFRSGAFGAQVAFTPDGYPVCDFVRENVYVVLDSNHGFKMLALGRLAAQDILRGDAPELEPFRLARFAEAALHPVSSSPYPWT